ncbi:MAG: class I SAM-dependent methyltransferase [Pseudomonadota bacterium]
MTQVIANKMMTSTPIRLEQVYTLGTILAAGMAELEQARVLQLGCNGGADILYHAVRFEDAQFVGLDSDAQSIAEASRLAQLLGLENVEFHHQSDNMIPHALGLFDYITCDGVLETIPYDTQAAFVQNCADHLSVRGVVCMGYATLPGANHTQSLLQSAGMLSAHIEKPTEKISSIHGLYTLLAQTAAIGNTVIKEAIDGEMRYLRNGMSTIAYLDRLHAQRYPVFYEQVLALGTGAKLRYMGDTNLASMFPFTYPEALAKLMNELPNQTLAQQYADHLIQRRERCSVFSTELLGGDGQISADRLQPIQFLPALRQANPQQPINFAQNASHEFLMGKTKIMTRTHVELAVCVTLLRNAGKPITLDILIEKTTSLLGDKADENAGQQMREFFLQVVICGEFAMG